MYIAYEAAPLGANDVQLDQESHRIGRHEAGHRVFTDPGMVERRIVTQVLHCIMAVKRSEPYNREGREEGI